MGKLKQIEIELNDLKQALEHIENAIDEYTAIDWPHGVDIPHHVAIEMEEARWQIEHRIRVIEDKLERI